MLGLPVNGGCQCGECRFVVADEPFVAYTCHCGACQKLTASAFLTCMHVAIEHVAITSGTPSALVRKTDSGNLLTTQFCSKCGSTLIANNTARPHITTVHVGALDEPAKIPVTAHIWVKRKLPWVPLPDGARIYDEAGDRAQDYERDPIRLGI